MPDDFVQLTGSSPASVKLYYVSVNGTVARQDTQGFEAWNDTNYSHYGVVATQQGTSNIWLASRPLFITQSPAMVVARSVVGNTPATDPVVFVRMNPDQMAVEAGLVDALGQVQLDVENIVGGDSGDIPVDHNTGGADNLRLEHSGNGVDGAIVSAYLASEWSSNPDTAEKKGQTITSTDGRWASPMMLNTENYTIVFTARGFQTSTKNVTVQ